MLRFGLNRRSPRRRHLQHTGLRREWSAPAVRSGQPDDKVRPDDNTALATRGGVNSAHWDDGWDATELRRNSNSHCMNSWTPGNAISGVPFMVKGDGVYLTDMDGKYVDLTSQAVCANLGYVCPNLCRTR